MSSTRRSSAERDKSKDSVAPASLKSVESPDVKSVESPDVDALHFPQIKRMDDVITNFFNQIVQYVIEDLIIVEPKEEPVVEVSDEGLVKDYKDLKAEDLVNAEVTATSGSKVVLSRKSSSKSLSRKKGSSARNVEKKAESGSLGRKVESSLRNVDKKTESSLRNVDKKTESSLRNVDKKTESSLRNVDRKTESSLRNVDKKTVSSLRNVDRRSESSVDKKLGKSMNASFTLETIKEEMSEASRSKTSTASSSLQDPLMEEEREVKIIFTNGNTYEGRISKRIMNGKGRYVWTDGTVYEGDFKDGFPTGKGTMVLPDLSRYEGEFNQGLFHGHGFLNIVATPTFYSGRWRNGLKHGEGWLLYEPGDWYEGGWANDFKDGFGLRCYKNGAKYRGEWREGKYDGRGMMIWENSDYYKGEWSKGAMHGKGEYIWKAFYNTTFAFPVQTIYRGEWAEGKRSGEGTMYFGDESGLKLKGKWDDDFKHGDGLLVCGNGRVVEQTLLFQYDKPTRTESSASSVPHNLLRQILDVPVFNAPEFVDVGFYVDKLLSKLQDVSDDKLKLLKTFEEKCIKNTIIRFLPQLKDLYRDYCSMAAKAQLHYEPVLIRLFLWQLYQDIDISRSGISLAGTDLILGENPNSCVENVHCPFEPIYFWQFLMSLVGVALSTISLEEIYDTSSSQGGVSSFVVKKFFDEVLFAKPSDHRGKYARSVSLTTPDSRHAAAELSGLGADQSCLRFVPESRRASLGSDFLAELLHQKGRAAAAVPLGDAPATGGLPVRSELRAARPVHHLRRSQARRDGRVGQTPLGHPVRSSAPGGEKHRALSGQSVPADRPRRPHRQHGLPPHVPRVLPDRPDLHLHGARTRDEEGAQDPVAERPDSRYGDVGQLEASHSPQKSAIAERRQGREKSRQEKKEKEEARLKMFYLITLCLTLIVYVKA